MIGVPDDCSSDMKTATRDEGDEDRVTGLLRHGTGRKVMKDRRTPRGGDRNRQRDYREERY